MQAQYTEALHHAEAERQRLSRELDHARAREAAMRSEAMPETTRPHRSPPQTMRDAALDPIPAAADRSIADEAVVAVVQLSPGRAGSAEPQGFADDADSRALPTAIGFWKQTSERLRAELDRLSSAHKVTVQTQLATAKENDRLLEYTADLEQRLRTKEQEHDREKENLLRTLHNLQDDIKSKATALDTLEEEAQVKIGEKRRRIAELEGQVESLQEAQERQLEGHVKYREEAAARAKELEAACDALREERRHHEEEIHTLKARLGELEKRATAGVQLQHLEEQHQKEKVRLIEAIQIAREQLIRQHHASSVLIQQNQEKDVALKKKEQELERCMAELEEAQKSSRARQKATLEMLSQMILTDK
ncbi:unnamed protein product [Phytomonas sp. EM1]|nr:unnamed protein product [Phytomonas sp. EM1]|eukprot:CCW63409.1 unnamed protein product [Phytomonas sp. isolate EM1]